MTDVKSDVSPLASIGSEGASVPIDWQRNLSCHVPRCLSMPALNPIFSTSVFTAAYPFQDSELLLGKLLIEYSFCDASSPSPLLEIFCPCLFGIAKAAGQQIVYSDSTHEKTNEHRKHKELANFAKKTRESRQDAVASNSQSRPGIEH